MRDPGPIPWRDVTCGWYLQCLNRAARRDELFGCAGCLRYHAAPLSLDEGEVAGCRALTAWIFQVDPALLAEGVEYRTRGINPDRHHGIFCLYETSP